LRAINQCPPPYRGTAGHHLAKPFTPTQHDRRFVAVGSGLQGPVHVRVERGDELLGEQATQLGRRRGPQHPGPLAQLADDLLGGCDADVGGDQGLLELLPGVLVQLVPRQQRQQPLPNAF
jgi:hypothetical protein